MEIKTVSAFEGPAIQYTGDDGYPKGYILPVIVATAHDGSMYQLPNSFKADYDEDGFQILKVRFDLSQVRDICDKIYARGYCIDEQHWVKLTQEELTEYLCGAYH